MKRLNTNRFVLCGIAVIGLLLIMGNQLGAQNIGHNDSASRQTARAYILLVSVVLFSLFFMVALIAMLRSRRLRQELKRSQRKNKSDSYVDIWGSYRLRPQDLEIMEDMKPPEPDPDEDDRDDGGWDDDFDRDDPSWRQ